MQFSHSFYIRSFSVVAMCNFYPTDAFAFCRCDVPRVEQLQGILYLVLQCCSTASTLALGSLTGYTGTVTLMGDCCVESIGGINVANGTICSDIAEVNI